MRQLFRGQLCPRKGIKIKRLLFKSPTLSGAIANNRLFHRDYPYGMKPFQGNIQILTQLHATQAKRPYWLTAFMTFVFIESIIQPTDELYWFVFGKVIGLI